MLKPLHKSVHDLNEEQQNNLLEPFVSDMVAYVEMLKLVGQRHFLRGIEQVHTTLHGQPGVDDEMLDQAVEFHSQKDPEDPDGVPVVFDD